METGRKISLMLIMLSLILALLPLTANRSFVARPETLLQDVLSDETSFSADQVAEFIVREDSTVQLIGLEMPGEFRSQILPGAVNVSYEEFITGNPEIWLGNRNIKTIFYSGGNLEASYAVAYARGMGYRNAYSMKGGLAEWNRTIIKSRFTGERITAHENALYETRRRAAEMFTELNALPDSLKAGFLASRKFSAKKLDGGCE